MIINGSRLIAGCFRFIFGSRYVESTCSKFGVSAYSRINMVICLLALPVQNIGLFCTRKYTGTYYKVSLCLLAPLKENLRLHCNHERVT